MSDIALAVIGGTGVYKLADLHDVDTRDVQTRFGKPSGPIRIGTLLGQRVFIVQKPAPTPDAAGGTRALAAAARQVAVEIDEWVAQGVK